MNEKQRSKETNRQQQIKLEIKKNTERKTHNSSYLSQEPYFSWEIRTRLGIFGACF